MKRLAFVVLLIGTASCVRPAQGQNAPAKSAPGVTQVSSGATPLTMKQAEAIALKNNPQITIGKLNALQYWQYVREARSALLPTANLSLTGVDSEAGSRIAAGGLNNPVIFPRAAFGASISQLITDFGRTNNLLGSAEYGAKAQDQNSAATTADIIIAVDRAFYSALDTQALVTIAEQTVSSRQALMDKIQALTQAKLKSDVDLSFSQVDLARAQLLLLETQNNYQSSLATLSAILGYPDQQNFQLVEEPQELTVPAPEVEPLIMQAIQQRPEISALTLQVESAEKNARAEHDLWMPTVSAIGVAGQAPVRDNRIPSWYGAAGVNINIPVFNGFLYNARAKAADLETEVNRQKLMDLRNNIARDVRISWQQTNQAYQRLSVTQQMEKSATLALDLAQQRYNLGLSSIVEFSQAELGKTEADITDTDAHYQYRLAQLVLAYTIAAPR